MSQLEFVRVNPKDQTVLFLCECSRYLRYPLELWRKVKAGPTVKPIIRCDCGRKSHIPPSPRAIEEFRMYLYINGINGIVDEI